MYIVEYFSIISSKLNLRVNSKSLSSKSLNSKSLSSKLKIVNSIDRWKFGKMGNKVPKPTQEQIESLSYPDEPHLEKPVTFNISRLGP